MSLISREQLAQKLDSLPPLPTAVTTAMSTFDNDDVDIGRICKEIGADIALTARLLRVANSSFFGLQRRVGTINDAVAVLGFRAVRSMLLALSVTGAFRALNCRGFDMRSFGRHCAATGLSARALAKSTKRNPDLAFAGGLLHDIGKLVLASEFASDFAEAIAYREQHDCPLVVAERDVLGIDHALVGGMLADAWCFPAELRSAIVDHHAPSAATADSLADLIHIADAVTHGLALKIGRAHV
jgi:putative nucleotidyltransferase with HDIG domain